MMGKRPTDGQDQDYGDADEESDQDCDRPGSLDDPHQPSRGRVHELTGERGL